MGPQGVLSLGLVLDHKVHDGMILQRMEGQARSGENLHWEMCVIKPLN